jgi:pimeloyl-ACP methyl ester carboxylesterase
MSNCARTIRQVALVGLLIIHSPALASAQTPPLWNKLPPGSHAVGFKTSWQLDYSRRYNMTFDDKTTYAPGKAPRPILVNVWYPARKAGDAKRMPHRGYLEIQSADPLLARFSTKLVEYDRRIIAKEVMARPAKELTDREKRLLDQFLDTPTACVRNAPHADGKFAVVIYHAGYGSSFEDNSVLCEFLASHGFIVLGSAFQEPRGSSFNVDGGRTSGRDMAFLIAHARQLPGADWNHVGVIGHSGGAHATLTFAAQINAPVDAVVSLDTTQDYHGLKAPGWEEMIAAVKDSKNFTCPVSMVAGPYAFFELADTLQKARRYYLTIKDMDHDDYISQGGIRRERLYQLHTDDPKQNAEARAREKSALERARAGYQALCLYILRFLEAELKGDAAGKGFLAKQYRDTQLGGDRPHVEYMPVGRTGPDPYKEDSALPPTPRQLRPFLREHGVNKTIALFKRFRKEAPSSPIYYPNFELNLVSDFLHQGNTRDAIAFHEYFRESGLDCGRIFLGIGKGYQNRAARGTAARYYKMALALDPSNREAAEKLKELKAEKKEP